MTDIPMPTFINKHDNTDEMPATSPTSAKKNIIKRAEKDLFLTVGIDDGGCPTTKEEIDMIKLHQKQS